MTLRLTCLNDMGMTESTMACMTSARASSDGAFPLGTEYSPFILLGFKVFLPAFTNALPLIQPQPALQSKLKPRIRPAIIHRNPSRRERTDAEWALNQHDVEATAVMRRARPFALFGPLPSTVTMIAIPVSLHFSGVGDLGFRVLLSMLLITIIHFANAC